MTENTTPSGFKDLDVEELRRTAIADFALTNDAHANKKDLLALFAEKNISFDEYLNLVPELDPAPVESLPSDFNEVQTLATEIGAPVEVVVAASPVVSPTAKYLIKMDRENPLFEIAGYKFTQEQPYALVSADKADHVLSEPGFRQATPRELKEFYA